MKCLAYQRRRFMREHPFCYYCGARLIELAKGHRGPVPDNAATIEHLRPRGDPSRREPNRFRLYRHVLACTKCNSEKARQWWALRSLEEKWRAAGHWPRMAYLHGALPGEVA